MTIRLVEATSIRSVLSTVVIFSLGFHQFIESFEGVTGMEVVTNTGYKRYQQNLTFFKLVTVLKDFNNEWPQFFRLLLLMAKVVIA